MYKVLGFITIMVLFPALCFSQKQDDPYQKKYEWRIRQEVLYGVYIPKDVNEALMELTRLTDAESKAKFKSMPEQEIINKLFFSLGRWMTHNWGFYDGSRLTVNLQQMGIYAPENMSRFLMILFHRSLNKKPLEIKELIQKFQEIEERNKQERLNNGTIIHEEIRQKPKPADPKNGG